MTSKFIALATSGAFFVLPTLAFADGDGAVTGAVGGAIAGAIVGGPVGAVIGGAGGAVIGGAATGDRRTVVVPVEPCSQSTTRSADNNGNTQVTQTTNCPN